MQLKTIAANQAELQLAPHSLIFFSYGVPVAAQFGTLFYRTNEKHSQTTTTHVNRWLENVTGHTPFNQPATIPAAEWSRFLDRTTSRVTEGSSNQ